MSSRSSALQRLGGGRRCHFICCDGQLRCYTVGMYCHYKAVHCAGARSDAHRSEQWRETGAVFRNFEISKLVVQHHFSMASVYLALPCVQSQQRRKSFSSVADARLRRGDISPRWPKCCWRLPVTKPTCSCRRGKRTDNHRGWRFGESAADCEFGDLEAES